MTTFDDRERAFENLFAHDQDLAFRARARCHRDFGLWAAHQLGRSGDDAQVYAGQVLLTSIEKSGSDAVLAKVGEDLRQHGIEVSDHQLRLRMEELLAQAVQHVKRE